MNYILSICSGNAIKEFNYVIYHKYPSKTSFIFYDPVYLTNIKMKNNVKILFSRFFKGDIIFCTNIFEVKNVFINNDNINNDNINNDKNNNDVNKNIILFIGFNICESIPIPKHLNLENIKYYIQYKKKMQSFYNLLDILIPNYLSLNVNTHIQTENVVVYKTMESFSENVKINK